MPCRYCGLRADASHASTADCVQALLDEIERLRAIASERRALPDGVVALGPSSRSATDQPPAMVARLALLT
jgi:hypothetical protein